MRELKEYINRNKSVLTGKSNLETLYTLKKFPVFFGCVKGKSLENELYADMNWAIDPETGVIQLTKLIPLEILYQSQHVDGCGPTWQQYYEDFSDYIARNKLNNILEIGGGQGQLAEVSTSKIRNLSWTILEPNPVYKENKNIKVKKGFFDENFKFDEKVDAVIFSQLLEHIYDPKYFLNTINKFLTRGGKLIFAYPNLELWLKNKYTNAINFEHTMFLSDYHVDDLLKATGFTIVDKTPYKDHSFFYVAIKVAAKKEKYGDKYNNYKKIFTDFINYHTKLVKILNHKIGRSKNPTYCFGAHIFTTYLLAFGLNSKKILALLDNSPTKQGKRLYGTNLMVESPKILKDKGRVNVILKAGIYNDEIKKDILENINPDVVFW